MDFKRVLLLLVVVSPLCLGKPLCDSLEDYFRKSKQPGAKRLKKTVTRICTAFDVVKYEGVDPIDLILPPAEDDDDIGTQKEKNKKDDDVDQDEDLMEDYDLSVQEEILAAAAANRFRFPGRWPLRPVRFEPWRFQRNRPLWQVSDRRHHNEKSLAKMQSIDEVEKTITSTSIPVTTAKIIEEEATANPEPKQTANKTFIDETVNPVEDNEYDEDEYDDDDDHDPILNDLADFVASVRFLSLNDTSQLNVIFPTRKISTSDKIDVGKPALAIEAPEELLPTKYRSVFPSSQDDSSLPEVYRIYTQFSCDKQQYKPGVYADLMTECQAFHLCLPTGHGFKSATFLCPRNLRYNQRILRCDWAGAVNCSDSAEYFVNNKHFGHNFTTYLQSLHTLLHGDGLDSGEYEESSDIKEESAEISTVNPKVETFETLMNPYSSKFLGKLRSIISSD